MVAFRIAENKPLAKLQQDLGNEPRQAASQEGIMGGPGAVIGYCQGLFNQASNPEEHTEHMIDELKAISAPWAYSHELLWEQHGTLQADKFVESAIKPLLKTGRVPILISSLDPDKDYKTIRQILDTNPQVEQGESVLFRWSLVSDASVTRAIELINDLLDEAFTTKQMPRWWPLLQGSVDMDAWHAIKNELGERFQYVNLAMNPFSPTELLETFSDNVTVSQFLVGHPDHINEQKGEIYVGQDVGFGYEPNAKSYDFQAYAQRIGESNVMPMSIICGKCRPEWSDQQNRSRVRSIMNLYKAAVGTLWPHMDSQERVATLAQLA